MIVTPPLPSLPAGNDGNGGVTITYTKNPDGSTTLTTPDGDKTVKPGDTGTLPNGSPYVVNPDGSLTITNPDGSKTTIFPGGTTNLGGGTTNNDGVTNNYYYGNGTDVNGKLPDGSKMNLTKNPDGTLTITFPDGSQQTVTVPNNGETGDKGTLPNGDTWTVNPDGTVTITSKDGKTKTILNVNQDKTPTGPTTGPDGSQTPDGPSTGINTTPTTDPGTAVTTPGNDNAGNNGGSDTTGTSTGAGEGTATEGAGDNGTATGTGEGTATAGNAEGGTATAQGTSAGTATTAEGATAAGQANGNKQAADKSALPQTDENQAQGVAALGFLGVLASLLGLAGAKKRRKDI